MNSVKSDTSSLSRVAVISNVIGLLASIITVYSFATGFVSQEVFPAFLQNSSALSVLFLVLCFYFCTMLLYFFCRHMRQIWSRYKQTENRYFGIFFQILAVGHLIYLPVFYVWLEAAIAIDFASPNYSIFHDVSGVQRQSETFLLVAMFIGFIALEKSFSDSDLSLLSCLLSFPNHHRSNLHLVVPSP